MPTHRKLAVVRGQQCARSAVLSLAIIAGILVGCTELGVAETPHATQGQRSAEAGPVYAGPTEEYMPLLAACLRDAGWDARVDSRDGSLSVDSLGASQREAFMAARDDCVDAIGAPPSPEPITDAEIRERYDFLLEARSCLMELGYRISDPPSLETFTETYSAGPWSPFNDLASQTASQEEWLEANEACPQT
jgi:hypothetical protein